MSRSRRWDSVTSTASGISTSVGLLGDMSLRLVQILRGKTIIQFICMIAIAATAFHADAKFASVKVNEAVTFADTNNDDQDGLSKVVAELCNFCSGTTACADVDALSVVELAHQPVPPGRTCRLSAYKLPATAPPPKS